MLLQFTDSSNLHVSRNVPDNNFASMFYYFPKEIENIFFVIIIFSPIFNVSKFSLIFIYAYSKMQHRGSRNIIGIRDKYSIWMDVYSLFKDFNSKDLHLITMNSVSGNRLSLYRDDGIGNLSNFFLDF